MSKRNDRHALYRIPLPLPFLAKAHLLQQQQLQQQQQSRADGSNSSTPSAATNSPSTITHHDHAMTTTTTTTSWWTFLLQFLTRDNDTDKKQPSTQASTANDNDDDNDDEKLIQAEFHPDGLCVWISDPKGMQILFRQGFFGKGTLSRSEPTWKQRQVDRGSQGGPSLEDITRQRRIERAKTKQEKRIGSTPTPPNTDQQISISRNPTPQPVSSSTPLSALFPLEGQEEMADGAVVTIEEVIDDQENDLLEKDIKDWEHLQLSLEEAFFLVFAVQCIQITHPLSSSSSSLSSPSSSSTTTATTTTNIPMTIHECWHQFANLFTSTPRLSLHQPSSPSPLQTLQPDNPFIIRYVVYHYYRGQGWVVKDGLKFGTDFVLYRKGMVFGHAERAIKVSCGSSSSVDGGAGGGSCVSRDIVDNDDNGREGKRFPQVHAWTLQSVYSWQNLLTLNRVISQVQKKLICCHVVLPESLLDNNLLNHPRTALPLYKILEFSVKRWSPERNRA